MIKKLISAALSWLIEAGFILQMGSDRITHKTVARMIVMTEGHRLITNRGLLVQGLRSKEFDRLELLHEEKELSLIAPQNSLGDEIQEKCWNILRKCMARKESVDLYTLNMFEYLYELGDIVLQIEFINSFYTEDGVDVVLDRDSYAQKALDIAYDYYLKHNLKTVEYQSRFFKNGFNEFDDMWKPSHNKVIGQKKACGLVEQCMKNIMIVLDKYPIAIERIKMLTTAAESATDSVLSKDDRSIIKVISEQWVKFKHRKTPLTPDEHTFFDVDYKNFSNRDISEELEAATESSGSALLDPPYTEPKSAIKIINDRLGKIVSTYAEKVLLVPAISGPHKPPTETMTVDQVLTHISETSAFFPPCHAAYETLYDTKLSLATGGFSVEIHLYKYVVIKFNNSTVLHARNFSLNSTEMFDDVGWNFENIEGFTLTDQTSDTPKYLKIVLEHGAGPDRLSNFEEIPTEKGCFVVTLTTPIAFNRLPTYSIYETIYSE